MCTMYLDHIHHISIFHLHPTTVFAILDTARTFEPYVRNGGGISQCYTWPIYPSSVAVAVINITTQTYLGWRGFPSPASGWNQVGNSRQEAEAETIEGHSSVFSQLPYSPWDYLSKGRTHHSGLGFPSPINNLKNNMPTGQSD